MLLDSSNVITLLVDMVNSVFRTVEIGETVVSILYFCKFPDVYVLTWQKTSDTKKGLDNNLMVSNNKDVLVLIRLTTAEELNIILSMELVTISDGKLNCVFNTTRGEFGNVYAES